MTSTPTIQKHIIHWSCKHYFGVVTVEASDRKEAKEKATEKICGKHIGAWDGGPEVDKECGKTCKFKCNH